MVAATGRETFDTLGEGVTITTGNTLFTTIATSGGKVALADAATRGARGVRFSGNAVSAWAEYAFATSQSTASIECYFKYKTADKPTVADCSFIQLRDATGGRLTVAWLTTGVLRLLNAAGGNLRNLNTNTELADGNYRLQITAVKGTTTSNGRAMLRLDNLTTGASIENYDSGTTVNTGTADYVSGRWGKTGATGVATIDIDDPAWLFASTAAIDLPSANASPTARAGNDQTAAEPYTIVTLNGTGSSDPEGTPLTYLWSQLAGTTATLSSTTVGAPTFTAPGTLVGDTLTFQLQVSDGVNTATDTVDITVLKVTEFAAVGAAWVPAQLIAFTDDFSTLLDGGDSSSSGSSTIDGGTSSSSGGSDFIDGAAA